MSYPVRVMARKVKAAAKMGTNCGRADSTLCTRSDFFNADLSIALISNQSN